MSQSQRFPPRTPVPDHRPSLPRRRQLFRITFPPNPRLQRYRGRRISESHADHPPALVTTQPSANADVVTGLIVVWYDNISLYLETSHSSVEANVADIKRSAKRVNAAWSDFQTSRYHKGSWKGSPPTFLGLLLDLMHVPGPDLRPCWRTDDGFLVKTARLAATLGPDATRRMVSRAVGCLIWNHYVRGLPLLDLGGIIAIARNNVLHTEGSRGSSWDEPSSATADDFRLIDVRLSSMFVSSSNGQL